MNLASLQDFLAVAEAGSLSEAAERRNISISALSRRLSGLEEWLGVILVDRQKRPNELTYAGHLFRDVALNVVFSLGEIRENLRREVPDQNILTFALPHTLRDKFFPQFLARVRERSVAFEAQILVGTEAARLREILEKGACHFLLYYSRADLPFRLPLNHSSCYLDDDRLVPVSAADHNGLPRFPVPGKPECFSLHLSQGPGSYFMKLVNDLVSKSARAPYLRQLPHTEGTEPFLQSVRDGKGMAWLPGRLVEGDLQSGKLIMAGSKEWSIDLQIRLARGKAPLSSCGEALWRMLELEKH
jgi:DNA-binding transcriptional LysR family regulator